jgi:peptide/nickel transport system ATP-binding protein
MKFEAEQPIDGPVLEVRNLRTEFPTRTGAFVAVDDVSLKLYPGKTLCVVGESGSGKSVLSRSILQILDEPGRIVAGDVVLHRRSRGGPRDATGTLHLTALKPQSSAMRAIRGGDIAMIFQEPMSSLSPVHRIGNQIGESLRLHEHMNKKQARARTIELLGQVGIQDAEGAADRYPFEFSGGMRQRAMIAMALACDPAVLIADEPTTALDVTIQAEILDLIKELQERRRMAVLFITHDMGVVAQIADEVAVMRLGHVVEQGDVFEIFKNPRHPYTRELIHGARDLDRPAPRRLEMRSRHELGAPILTAVAVRKEFSVSRGMFGLGHTTVLGVKDVSFELKAGENLGIAGESGSGKTTLIRCVQRAISVTSGKVVFQHESLGARDLAKLDHRELKPFWRNIRTVFQDPFGSLNPRMTVAEIIGEPLLVSGELKGRALRARVEELLEMVGLPASAAQRYPHAFSGGQRQRIAIARAIGPHPRVIIADEPTSALDVGLRAKVLDLLLDLQERLDLSFIFVSHDLSVLRYFCDRLAIMKRGEILEIGDTEAVCTAPQHPYTKALLSAIPHADPSQRGTDRRIRYAEA